MRSFSFGCLLLLSCGGPPAPAPVAIAGAPSASGSSRASGPTPAASSSAKTGALRPRPTIVALAPAGAAEGLAADGTIWHWASGVFLKQLTVPGARAIASDAHTCVLLADGSPRCWGRNARGELGDGTSTERAAPVAPKGVGPLAEVAVGSHRTCARASSGDVLCWGDREWGALGDGSKVDNDAAGKPLAGAAILTGATSLGVGLYHACATRSDGSVWCWGTNDLGQCGLPIATRTNFRPARAPLAKDAVFVAASEQNTCIVNRAGRVSCWGEASRGALGDGTTGDGYKPEPRPHVVTLPAPATLLCLGSGHACARLTDGRVACWGENGFGQLGDGTATSTLRPVLTKMPEPAEQLSCTLERTCALGKSGHIWCWGRDYLTKSEQLDRADALVPAEPWPPSP